MPPWTNACGTARGSAIVKIAQGKEPGETTKGNRNWATAEGDKPENAGREVRPQTTR
jgi:hypothetical protein